jgi:hypothetical protein
MKRIPSYKIEHPLKLGTLTNIGTIASWKYVRYGFGKYKYFTFEHKYDFPQEDITEIYKNDD